MTLKNAIKLRVLFFLRLPPPKHPIGAKDEGEGVGVVERRIFEVVVADGGQSGCEVVGYVFGKIQLGGEHTAALLVGGAIVRAAHKHWVALLGNETVGKPIAD